MLWIRDPECQEDEVRVRATRRERLVLQHSWRDQAQARAVLTWHVTESGSGPGLPSRFTGF